MNRVGNMVTKGEIGRFEQFLLLSPCRQKAVRKRLYEGKGKHFPRYNKSAGKLQLKTFGQKYWKSLWMKGFFICSFLAFSPISTVCSQFSAGDAPKCFYETERAYWSATIVPKVFLTLWHLQPICSRRHYRHLGSNLEILYRESMVTWKHCGKRGNVFISCML